MFFNKHFFLIFTLILLIFILLPGCEFDPDNVPETLLELPEESGPPIILKLNDCIDTIKIGWTTAFQYQISGTKNKIRSVIVNFEGKEIHHYIVDNQQTFSFNLNPSSYGNGNYNLNIEINTETGTGSIADKLGAEEYLYRLDWPVYVDKALPVDMSKYKVSANLSNHRIELNWPAFNHPNFNSYIIFRQVYQIQDNYVPIDTIFDPLITTYIDTTFWEGESSFYYLGISTPAGTYVGGKSVTIYSPLTGLKAEWHNDGTVNVKWDKAQNLESFSKYYVYSKYSSSNKIEEYFIGDPNQNFVTLQKAGLGIWLNIYMTFIPKEVSGLNFRYEKIVLEPPPMFPIHYKTFNVNGNDFLLLTSFNSDKIWRYYPNSVRTEDSISAKLSANCPLSVTNNGEKFIYYHDSSFCIRGTNDFVLKKEFAGPSFKSESSNLLYYSLSDNGKLLVLDNKGNVYLYNANDGILIHKDTLTYYGFPLTFGLISPDGTKMIGYSENLLFATRFFSFEADGWKESAKSLVNPRNIVYSKNGTTLYIFGWDNLENRRANDFLLLSTNTFSSSWFQSVDINNERQLWTNGVEGLILDLATSQILMKTIIGDGGPYILFNNFILNSPGLQLTLPKFE
jgi:hypothetical protein